MAASAFPLTAIDVHHDLVAHAIDLGYGRDDPTGAGTSGAGRSEASLNRAIRAALRSPTDDVLRRLATAEPPSPGDGLGLEL